MITFCFDHFNNQNKIQRDLTEVAMENYYYNAYTYATQEELRMAHAQHVIKTVKLLFWQFAFTFLCLIATTYSYTVFDFLLNHYSEFTIFGIVGSLASVIYIVTTSRKTEGQVAIFTVFETLVVCLFSMNFSVDSVMIALAVTIGICSALIVYAVTTYNDHTDLIGYLYSSLTALVAISLSNIFLNIQILHLLWTYAGCLIFFGYIVYDIQYFLTEKATSRAFNTPDLYILAALNIYLDILNILIHMIEIIAFIKGDQRSSRIRERRDYST